MKCDHRVVFSSHTYTHTLCPRQNSQYQITLTTHWLLTLNFSRVFEVSLERQDSCSEHSESSLKSQFYVYHKSKHRARSLMGHKEFSAWLNCSVHVCVYVNKSYSSTEKLLRRLISMSQWHSYHTYFFLIGFLLCSTLPTRGLGIPLRSKQELSPSITQTVTHAKDSQLMYTTQAIFDSKTKLHWVKHRHICTVHAGNHFDWLNTFCNKKVYILLSEDFE